MKKILFLLLVPFLAHSTSIAPYASFTHLKESATHVLYVESIDNNLVKVKTPITSYPSNFPLVFEMQKYAPTGAMIFGEAFLETGNSYLIFLDKNNRPLCLSYYVFKEVGKLLVPIETGLEIGVEGADPLWGAYDKDSLLLALSNPQASFPVVKPISSLEKNPSFSYLFNPPSQCTFFTSSGRPIRYKNPALKAYLADTTAGTFCGGYDYNSLLHRTTDSLNLNYIGISYEVSVTPSGYSANCGDGTALGSDFFTHADTNYGINACYVFFDDPCSEISDLSMCSGILAFGGTYFSGTHIFNTDTFWSARYPFVVMNNGLASCFCSSIPTILIHELTHTLGIGHISGSFGAANMNPSCCNDITSLDIECLDFYYPYCFETNEWVGGVSNDWFTPGNWSLGTLPDSCSDVFIYAGDSVFISQSGAARARTLSVDSSAILATADTLINLNISK